MQFSGVPFAANPLSGLWYPPNLLLLILPLTAGFNLLLAAHLYLGGLGMIRLLRRLGAGPIGSLVAGLAWALTPKIWAHLGAGHVGLVYAAGWLSWVALAAIEFARSSAPADRSRLAIAWALQFLADPRLAIYSAAAVAGVVLWWIAGQDPSRSEAAIKRQSWPRGRLRIRLPRRRESRLGLLPPWLGAGVLALALPAIQWLPLLDYLPTTGRVDLTAAQSAIYSLPPWNLVGLVWADRGGFHEWIVYVGIFVLGFALLGSLVLSRRTRWGVTLGLLLLALFALGDYTPLYSLLSRLPGATLLRVPPRVWFLVSFCLAVLAGLGADLLTSSDRTAFPARYRGGLSRSALIGLSATGLTAAGLLFVQGAESVAVVAWASFFWLLAFVILSVASQRWRWSSRLTGGLFVVVMVAELSWMDSSLVARKPAAELFADGQETARYLARQDGRLYAPSFRPPPQVAAVSSLRIVNGVDPLQPADYVSVLSVAAGVPQDAAYSITLPPLPAGWSKADRPDVSMALADATPSPWLLAMLDVDLVVCQFPLESPLLTELYRQEGEGLIVYRNGASIRWPAVFHRVKSVPDMEGALAWIQTGPLSSEAVVTGGRSLDGPRGYMPADLILSTPNRLVVRATGPGLLVLSELVHPGWNATVDGEPAEILAADAVLRGVYLDEGDHQVEMVYQPVAVMVGAGITIVALFIALCTWRFGKSVSN